MRGRCARDKEKVAFCACPQARAVLEGRAEGYQLHGASGGELTLKRSKIRFSF
jgi:hypothetical protein